MGFTFPLSSINILPSAPISSAFSFLHLLHFFILLPSLLVPVQLAHHSFFVLTLIPYRPCAVHHQMNGVHWNNQKLLYTGQFVNTCLSFVFLAEKDVTSSLQLQRFMQSPFLDMAITPSLWPSWSIRDIYMALIYE